MKKLFKKWFDTREVPFGVKVLTAATSVRWIGWGFAESLIPVFLFAFAGTFAEAGLLKSTYDIAYILVLPIAGILADRMRATTLILVGLWLYIFVGVGYALAGVTGLAIFIAVTRFLNGVGYALDSVGRSTYLRRHTPSHAVASALGYFDTISTFWWIAAALVGIFLVKIFALHWILFLITPTVVLSIGIVFKWARPTDVVPSVKNSERSQYKDIMREFVAWRWQLKSLVGLNFFLSFTGSVVAFFLPIQMFTEGSGYAPIIIMTVVLAAPAVFGWELGKMFDSSGPRIFGYALLVYALLLAGLGFTQSYIIQIAIALGLGFVQELLSVGKEELVTVYANPEHFGRVDGLSRSIANIGALAGPIIVGVLIDTTGVTVSYLLLAVLMALLAGGFVLTRWIVHNYRYAS